MEQIKEGMRVRVRVAHEGVVDYVSTFDGAFDYYTDAGQMRTVRRDELNDVEILAPPPPKFEVGAFYRMRENGCTYVRTKNGWAQVTHLAVYSAAPDASYPADECTFIKLVPEVES